MMEHETNYHPIQQWLERSWLLVALLIPLFVNLWVEQQFEASKIWLMQMLVWTLAILWLIGRYTGVRSRSLSLPIRNSLLALCSVLTLATLFSSTPTIALFGSLDRANGLLTQLTYFLLFWIVATHINAHQSRQLLWMIILTAVPITLFGLAQAAGWHPLPVFTDARSNLVTTLGRANFTGAYLALLLPLIVAAVQTTAEKKQKFSLLVLFVLTTGVVILTQARAAWIASIVGLASLFWFQNASNWTRKKRWLSGLGGLIGLVSGLSFILRWGIVQGGSIAARWTIWQASLKLLWPHLWLGYGADTLEQHFTAVYPPQLVYYQGRGVIVDRAHNWLLDFALSYGIVATLILLILLCFILFKGWQQLHQASNNKVDFTWLTASMASICGYLVGNLFLFDVAATAVVFWLLLAVVTASLTPLPSQPARLLRPSRFQIGLIAVTLILFASLTWVSAIKPLLADSAAWRGTQAISQGNLAKAQRLYETAVMHQPQHPEYRVAYALTSTQLGDFAVAESAMLNAITLQPTNPTLRIHLATIYANEATQTPRKVQAAYAAYDQAISLAPTVALYQQQFAEYAFHAGDSDLALQLAQQATELDATDGNALALQGWVLLELGNPREAEKLFKEAVRWQTNSAEIYLGLATALYEQGEREAAREALAESLKVDPFYTPALSLQLELVE